jgi:hypothetical protein
MPFEPPSEWTPDPRAQRILFDTYWSSRGWIDQPTTPPKDFAYARDAGYMFPPLPVSHDVLIAATIRARSVLDPVLVGQAFSDSLTSQRLDLRSALGSFGAALHLPQHPFQRSPWPESPPCAICGDYSNKAPQDLNILSFERLKWGGVRHADPLYALFDLSMFRVSHTASQPLSREPLLRILDAASRSPAEARPNDLLKSVASIVAGNADQRRSALACLSYAGILQPGEQASFLTSYPIGRDHPGGKNDWPWPLCWWRGRDGVNEAALAFYFPTL